MADYDETDDILGEATNDPVPPVSKWQHEAQEKDRKEKETQRATSNAISAFNEWKQDPTPEQGTKLLSAVNPYVRQAINMHVGKSSPLIESRAKRMALDSLRRYDPAQGAAINTYIVGQLQGLKRVARNQRSAIKVPERDSRDTAFITSKMNEFEDENGYEPSLQQLSDYTNVPLSRIQKLRSMSLPIHSTFFENGGEDSESFSPTVRGSADSDLWEQIVYHDLDPIDQKIMEWTTGRGGSRIRQTADIARKLRLSPGAISQRRKKIQDLLDQGNKRVSL